jgi:hypothetical protein
LRKVIQIEDRFPTGEATVSPVLLWGPSGKPLIERVKTASEASDYVASVVPRPGMTIVLVLAVSAYERFDLNRNGDGFPEHPYKQGLRPTCGCCEPLPGGWIQEEETLPHHYRSFEEHGRLYLHHANNDPAKSVGDVLKAFWNQGMHRVELLVGVRNSLAPDVVARIADGEYPACSMGCRILFDCCTICGHRARTRKDYCDHLKRQMRQVMPSGIRAGALNPSPRFFDLSFVVRPADQAGWMLKKVAYTYDLRSSAEDGEYLDAVEEKRSALRKVADIDKVVRGIPVDAKSTPLSPVELHNVEQFRDHLMPAVVGAMPVMDDQTIGALAAHPVAKVLSTLSAAGVILTTPEFLKLLVAQLAPGTPVSDEALDAAVALQGHVFDLFARHPQMLDQLMSTGLFDVSAKNVDPVIAEKAEEYLEKRSTLSDYLQRALVPPEIRPEEPHWSDPLHVRDPGTGNLYATSRGAAAHAHDAIARRQLAKLVGGGALLAGAYKVLAAGLPAVLRPVAAGAATLMGWKHLRPDFGPQYMTEEGVPISTLTELTPAKTGSQFTDVALPILGTGALIVALGHDYDSRLRRTGGIDPGAPLAERLLDRLGQYASDHPAMAFLGGLGAYGLGSNLAGKFAEYLGEITEPSSDPVHLPEVDIDRVALRLGALITR